MDMNQPQGFSKKQGIVDMPPFDLPISIYMSQEAGQAFIEKRARVTEFGTSSNENLRETTDRHFWTPLLEKAQARYSTHVEKKLISGIPTFVTTPDRIAEQYADCVLINLHGGSFELGNGGLGSMVESIPIAAVSQFKVISIDYRQSPEHRFPAASEDVAAVYRELLKTYKPENIGIYGCSAGAILTSGSMAWFIKEQLPLPGAIGLFCAGADPRYGGDSRFITSPQCFDTPIITDGTNPPPLLPGYRTYFEAADLRDPLVSPALSPETLRKFPPTLLISGTRAYDLSSAAYTHTRLRKLGVETELYVWDGMWHGFHYDVDLPESREVFDIAAEFFRSKLAQR